MCQRIYCIFFCLLSSQFGINHGCEIKVSMDSKMMRVVDCELNGLIEQLNDLDVNSDITGVVFTPNTTTVNQFPSIIFSKYPNVETCTLTASSLEEIQSGSFQNAISLKVLNLERNLLTELRGRSFEGAHDLEILKLGKNQISAIAQDAFFGLLNLKELNLYLNQIKHLPSDVFSSLVNLESINLNYNSIETLPRAVFEKNEQLQVIKLFKNNLKTFNINLASDSNFCYLNVDNNSIEYFELEFKQIDESSSVSVDCDIHGIHASSNQIEYFYVTPTTGTMKMLVLDVNRLNSIENITRIEGLRQLDLSSNPSLTGAELSKLSNMKNLQALSLRSLKLKNLDADVFSKLKDLRELDVSNNELQYFPIDIFPDNLNDFYKLNIANNKIIHLELLKFITKFPNLVEVNIFGNLFIQRKLIEVTKYFNEHKVTVLGGMIQ